MKRKQFVQTTSSMALGALIMPDFLLENQHRSKILTSSDLSSFLKSQCKVDEPSVDRIIVGDPETVITKIGNAWMPYWETLKSAITQGINTMVVHEPTFYTHWDLDETKSDYFSAPSPGKEVEPPWMEENCDYSLEENMTFQADTFVQHTDFGLRWENGLRVTKTGTDMFSYQKMEILEL